MTEQPVAGAAERETAQLAVTDAADAIHRGAPRRRLLATAASPLRRGKEQGAANRDG